MAQILVVEDDPMSALVIERVLTRMGGHGVGVLTQGDDLFARLRAGQGDLVVMDVSLSDTQLNGASVDGVALTRALKKDRQTRAIPVLLLTAHAMRGDRERLLEESGADDYLAKPIVDHRGLCALIDSMLAKAARS